MNHYKKPLTVGELKQELDKYDEDTLVVTHKTFMHTQNGFRLDGFFPATTITTRQERIISINNKVLNNEGQHLVVIIE